ncbi:uncharacterized protein FSUBG_9701 [Fusarium subglutinans]|uniref:Uncharacterized protein n=1 Tax=Gibberella subglutinans TaxID=42677 RepID=A0A8H5UPN0_GIBSU|nr:uncharacterized protein FSUBG_9701 [Fusarium subglutinans]KAF5593793.1 hypothetical protein FSUBG_9701 [Fusarium subglutinans]
MTSTDSTSASTEPRVITGWKRVAWPELRADPLETSVTSLPGPMLEISRDILELAHEVVKRHNILPSLKDRDDRIRFEVRDGITTLLIVTPWSSKKTPIWEAALREIVTSLNELTKETSICEGDIHAEIIAPELTQTIYYTFNNDPHLSATWDSVRPKVYKCLESVQATRHRMSSIALHRYGVLPELEANPATIYIGVDYRSDETGWNEVVTDIKNMLQGEEGWGHVNVHMEHNVN